MREIALLDQTVQWLEEAPINGQTLDDKVRQLLQAEYLRKLGQFHRADMVLSCKYGMDFRQFMRQRVMEKYEIIIYWSEEDQVFVAEVPELPAVWRIGTPMKWH
jgi:hypothetical protein